VSKSLLIAVKDLRQRLRDRSALLAAAVAPLGIAVIVSVVFGGGFMGTFDARYAVYDGDRSPLSTAFVDQVLRAPQLREQIEVVRVPSAERARELVRDDEVGAAFVIPRGFFASVTANRKAAITVLGNPDAPISSEVAEALAGAYTSQINASRLAVATVVRARGGSLPPSEIAELARAAAADRIPVQLVDGDVSVREIGGASYFGPAMAMFALFYITSFSAQSLLAEREQGTLARVLAAPVRRSAVIGGKAVVAFVLGSVSLAVMFLTFGLFPDVTWGDPLALIVLSAVSVIAMLSLTSVVQVFARTQQQAGAFTGVLAVVLALIGGSFFPLFQMPEAVQRISVVAPNAWALRAYTEIIYDGATLSGIWPHLAFLIGFAIVAGGFALWRARRISLR
jgi:ABC-2 type transport system permease protein